ncbi:MAG: hypothetical protein ACYCXX_07355 [Acidiferrobacter thiooxydans]
MCNCEVEKIVEFLEEQGGGFGAHHTLYFDPVGGTFVLESIEVEINEGDVSRVDLDSQAAYEWCIRTAGMEPVAAARAIIGADEDTPR